MNDITTLKNVKLDYNKLKEIGFIKEKDTYKFKKNILDDQFILNIEISNNEIKSYVIEKEFNEEFIPYNIGDSFGNYVGQMRNEYDLIIEKILETCSEKNIFKEEYTNLVIKYIKEKYNDEFEYLWEKFPEFAITRNKTNKKWYCLLGTVDKSKLDKQFEGKVEIIDLRLEPEEVDKIVDDKKYYRGYHMNKKHWITIILDGSVNIEEIYNLIDISYNLSLKK